MRPEADGCATRESEAYASAIYWADDDGAWCKLGATQWQCLVPGTGGLRAAATARPRAWRPWTRLVDDAEAPYLTWFRGAMTNIALSAVDAPAALEGAAAAYEAVSAEDARDRLTRAELLAAVLACRGALDLTPASRVYLHASTGLEQAVVCHALARAAACYTCTALDATDEALAHRFRELRPDLVVAASDAVTRGEAAAARCARLFGDAGPRFAVRRGDAKAWAARRAPYAPPVAVGDAAALMVVFTSGSTGRPKGLVHGHGGYGACVARTMDYVFAARAGHDRVLTLGTFAWITGQSYMLYGPALAGCASILVEGSLLGGDGLRWARVALTTKATILKCAAAFVRQAMADPERRAALVKLDLPRASLRMGTFCAEPLSADVQRWAARHVVAPFVNSYWATEHGSIAASRDPAGRAAPDAKCWPVPWVSAAVEGGRQRHGGLRVPVLLGDGDAGGVRGDGLVRAVHRPQLALRPPEGGLDLRQRQLVGPLREDVDAPREVALVAPAAQPVRLAVGVGVPVQVPRHRDRQLERPRRRGRHGRPLEPRQPPPRVEVAQVHEGRRRRVEGPEPRLVQAPRALQQRVDDRRPLQPQAVGPEPLAALPPQVVVLLEVAPPVARGAQGGRERRRREPRAPGPPRQRPRGPGLVEEARHRVREARYRPAFQSVRNPTGRLPWMGAGAAFSLLVCTVGIRIAVVHYLR